jgi:Protein of unknown function (DUF1592)/Protein of unknown function (DUF1588)/Protein of unknown function (DUF1595)/Protein of unknown function (DUF1587)/Protein of unknown function (DUF1585)
MQRVLSVVAPVALLLAVGCVNGEAPGTGAASAGAGGSAANPAAGSGSSGASLSLATALAPPDPCTSGAPGPRKLWRLTASEFAASIRSIFGDSSNAAPIATVFSDPSVLGFAIDANALLVQGLNASQLQDNAEAIAAWVASSGKLASFASCAASASGAPDAGCASQFVLAFGRLAFRGTLAESDPRVTSYGNLFLSGSSNSDGAQVVVSAMLQSPYFLYRSELGTASGSSFTLTPAEVATEVAYTLTGTTPDSTLLAAVDAVNSGSLSTASMIDQQAARLIAANSSTSSAAVMGFMDGWLGLSRLYTTAHDATIYQTSASLQQAMWSESQALILEAFSGNGTFGSALTADHSFLNQELSTFYGIPATGLGSAFSSVKYAGLTPRDPGLLATGTLLNGYARPTTDSPTQRGHLIRSRLLCQDIAPPPAGVNTTFMPATSVETTRDHFINEHESGVCAVCHKQMDWIGFAFENYDGFGRYRTTDNGLPTDNAAIIYGDPKGVDAPVSGLSGTGSLSAYLAQSDDVTRCMQRYWTYYTFGSSTWSQDACTYDSVYNESKGSGFTLLSTLLAIIHAATFTTRVQDR